MKTESFKAGYAFVRGVRALAYTGMTAGILTSIGLASYHIYDASSALSKHCDNDNALLAAITDVRDKDEAAIAKTLAEDEAAIAKTLAPPQVTPAPVAFSGLLRRLRLVRTLCACRRALLLRLQQPLRNALHLSEVRLQSSRLRLLRRSVS